MLDQETIAGEDAGSAGGTAQGIEQVPSGAAVLDAVYRFLTRFIVFPSDHEARAAAVWVVYTHAAQLFFIAPRLAWLGPEPQCGKTLAMDVTGTMVRKPKPVILVTSATLFTMIEKDHPTLAIDETDNLFPPSGKSRGNKPVLTVLNEGYRRGAKVPRLKSGEIVDYDVFTPVMFAGIGHLPESLASRCVEIRMRRLRNGEKPEPYIPRVHESLGQAVGAAAASWVQSAAGELAEAWPDMPEGIASRASEIWGPLMAVCDAAGGQWPALIRDACTVMVLGASTGDEVKVIPPAQQIWLDVAKVWPPGAGFMTRRGEAMTSMQLARLLLGLPDSPWASMWPPADGPQVLTTLTEMASLLRQRGMTTEKIREPGAVPKQGYYRPAGLPDVPVAVVPAEDDEETGEAAL